MALHLKWDYWLVKNSTRVYLPFPFVLSFFFWIWIAVTILILACGFVCVCRTLPMLSWMTWERTGVTLWSCRQFHTGVRSPSRAPRPFFSLLQAKDNLVKNYLIAIHFFFAWYIPALIWVLWNTVKNSCKCFPFVNLYFFPIFDSRFRFGKHSQSGLYKTPVRSIRRGHSILSRWSASGPGLLEKERYDTTSFI